MAKSSFQKVSEYSTKRARIRAFRAFAQKKVSILVVTERFLFYTGCHIFGATQAVFFGPPRFPSTLLNVVKDMTSSETKWCLVYWDNLLHLGEAERVVGYNKVGMLATSSKPGKLVAIKETLAIPFEPG